MGWFNWLSKNKYKEEVEKVRLEGYCPNCWGREEYGGKYYKALKNQRILLKQINPDKGWIQDYAEKYLIGIKLDISKENSCPTCNMSYQMP